ncbi:MAG: Ni/Fe-hydrogenase cytochrome b subunit [Phycisphaerae bacterium]|nr:Ni/Fe-hydrogenase cytochrome b subunit [Phycisphaerae bacterium]
MSGHELPVPANRKFFTPGVFLLLILAAIMACVAVYRFVFVGLAGVANINQQYPWGIWISIDVATGVALAAGGFTTATLAHIFHREHYHAIARPALLTAMLGYTFVGIGLMFDLGRWYNIWHPIILWQGNSVLFEVGMCVVCYINVLYIEFLPVIYERFQDDLRWPTLKRICTALNGVLGKTMFLFVIAGTVLSCLHQSSLGNLMVIAPSKFHDLWDTSICSLLFLLSAFMVGFPMVIFESMFASWSLKLKPEMEILSPLSKYIVFFTGVYLTVKVTDMLIRGSYTYLTEGSLQSNCFIIEMVFGVIVPFVMLMFARVRNTPRLLFIAALLIVLGVVFNRVNVFLIAYQPPYVTKSYFPSIFEISVTLGLMATLMLIYRLAVTYLPVITHPELSARKP